MNTKHSLLALTVAILLIAFATPAIITLQTNTHPKTINITTWTINSGIITPQGGGGDPVPGPGIPK